MKRFLFLGLLTVCLAVRCLGVDVLFVYADCTGTAEPVRGVSLRPLWFTEASPLTTADRVSRFTGTNGQVTITGLVPGTYEGDFYGLTTVTTNWFTFPNTNQAIASQCLATNYLAWSNIPGYSRPEADLTFQRIGAIGGGGLDTNEVIAIIKEQMGGGTNNLSVTQNANLAAPVNIIGTPNSSLIFWHSPDSSSGVLSYDGTQLLWPKALTVQGAIAGRLSGTNVVPGTLSSNALDPWTAAQLALAGTGGGGQLSTMAAKDKLGREIDTTYALIAGPVAGYFVATSGSDSDPGTFSQPFATLEAARNAMRAAGPTNVYVRGGTYFRTNALALTSADSYQTWAAYPGETVTLVGGLPITNWQIWQGNILVTDVSTQGFGNRFTQLLFGGVRQTLARYPNYSASDPYGSGFNFVIGYNTNTTSKTQFTNAPGDVPHVWTNAAEVQVVIYPYLNFWNNVIPVDHVDAAHNTVYLASQTSYINVPGERYYFQNALQELDAAGEWYLDGNSRYLYFYPPSSISGTVWAPVVTNLITVGAGAQNVTVSGFTLTCCPGVAVTLNNTTNCAVSGNTIRYVGDYNNSAVTVSGFGNVVSGNDIEHVGRSGIELSGGIVATLTAANNCASNNYLAYSGMDFKEGVGVYVTGVGNQATHNEICYGPRFGIYFYGQNLSVDHNNIHDVMLETDDGGGIYTEGINWLGSRGSVVASNYVHDLAGWGFYYDGTNGTRLTPYQTYGIYIDGFASGVTVQGNVATRVNGGGIYINGGSDNRILNNVIVDCLHDGAAPDPNNFQIHARADLNYWSGRVSAFNTGFYSVNGQSAWASMPGMTVAPTNHADSNGLTTWSNVFAGNVISYTTTYPGYAYYNAFVPFDRNSWNSNVVYHYGAEVDVRTNSSFPTWAQWQSVPQDAASITNDPLLNADFSLSSSSPALGLGIQSVSTSGAGWAGGGGGGTILSASFLSSGTNTATIRVGSIAGNGNGLTLLNGAAIQAGTLNGNAAFDAQTKAQLLSVPLSLTDNSPGINGLLSLVNTNNVGDSNRGVYIDFTGYEGPMARITAYNNPWHTYGGSLEFDTYGNSDSNEAPFAALTLTGSDSTAVFGGIIIGNGLGITNLNGANISPGTINSNALDPWTAAQLALAGSGGSGAWNGGSVSQPIVSYSRPAFKSMIAPTYMGGDTNSYWLFGANASLPDFTVDLYSNGVFTATRFMFTPEGPLVAPNFSDTISIPGTNTLLKPTIATNARNVFSGNGSGLTALNPANLSSGTAGISVTGSAGSVLAIPIDTSGGDVSYTLTNSVTVLKTNALNSLYLLSAVATNQVVGTAWIEIRKVGTNYVISY